VRERIRARRDSTGAAKARGGNFLNFRMFSPKARRITPLVTIPAGMARHFLFFWVDSVEAAVSAATLHATRLRQGFGVAGTRAATAIEAARKRSELR
jgi:hypothetical protein